MFFEATEYITNTKRASLGFFAVFTKAQVRKEDKKPPPFAGQLSTKVDPTFSGAMVSNFLC